MRAHATPYRQRHETLLGGPGDQIKHRAAVLDGGVDVQKTQLIRTGGVIGAGSLDRIARVDQIDEIDTLDHPAIGDIKTGDNAGF